MSLAGSSNFSTQKKIELLQFAKKALQYSYAPYSKIRVGAALLTSTGNIFTGCNVENASFGLTICAERVAVFSAISQEGSGLEIIAIAVVGKNIQNCSPCGACRQVIAEFSKTAIVLFYENNNLQEKSIQELLPHDFSIS